MRKFTRSITIFIFPILMFCAVSEYLLRSIPNDNTYKRDYLEKYSDSIKVLILGSSHALFGIDPSFLSVRGFNSANYSQDYRFDLAILEKYEEKLRGLRYIIIPASYLSFYDCTEKGEESWRIKNYELYYGLSYTKGIERIGKTEMGSWPLETNIRRMFSYYIKHRSAVTCSQYGWCTKEGNKTEQEMKSSGKEAVLRHTNNDELRLNRNTCYIESILDIAVRKKIKVLLFFPPAYHSYYKLFDSRQFESVIETVKGLTAKYQNAKYVNFLVEPSFSKSDFYDADHVNSAGAKKLTLKIDSLLRTM